jgi:hypothetical protein
MEDETGEAVEFIPITILSSDAQSVLGGPRKFNERARWDEGHNDERVQTRTRFTHQEFDMHIHSQTTVYMTTRPPALVRPPVRMDEQNAFWHR